MSPLPELLDTKAVMEEMGVKRATAEAFMRLCPAVLIPGLRKWFVKREDLLAVIAEHTYAKDQVPAMGN